MHALVYISRVQIKQRELVNSLEEQRKRLVEKDDYV